MSAGKFAKPINYWESVTIKQLKEDIQKWKASIEEDTQDIKKWEADPKNNKQYPSHGFLRSAIAGAYFNLEIANWIILGHNKTYE